MGRGQPPLPKGNRVPFSLSSILQKKIACPGTLSPLYIFLCSISQFLDIQVSNTRWLKKNFYSGYGKKLIKLINEHFTCRYFTTSKICHILPYNFSFYCQILYLLYSLDIWIKNHFTISLYNFQHFENSENYSII